MAHMVCVPTRIAQGLGAGGLIRGDERVQIVGVLEMQVAEQSALGERLARRQRVDGQQPAERAVFGGGSAVRSTKVGELSSPCSMTRSMAYS